MVSTRLAAICAACSLGAIAAPYNPDTHNALIEQAAVILSNDGRSRYADWTNTYLADLQAGSEWADLGLGTFGGVPWNAATHYCDPWGRGLFIGSWYLPSGATVANQFMVYAASAWVLGDRHAAAKYLGVVCHLVEDMTVPHHSNCTPFFGHSSYEGKCSDWSDPSSSRYASMMATSGGLYDFNALKSAGSWVLESTGASYGLFPLCDTLNPTWLTWWIVKDDLPKVAKQMMPFAERKTAGAIAWFLWMAGY